MAWWQCPVCKTKVAANYGLMKARSGDIDVEGPDCPDCGMVCDGPCEAPGEERNDEDE